MSRTRSRPHREETDAVAPREDVGSGSDDAVEIDGDALLGEAEDAAEVMAEAAAEASAGARPGPAPSEPAPREGEADDRLEEMRERWLRARADLENFRRRTERERERMRSAGIEDLARALLPVLDDLDRALGAEGSDVSLREGVELITRSLREVLAGVGLEAIPAEGATFDPNVHEAGETETGSDTPPQTVVAELRRGYRLGDRVLRPALVRVAVASGESDRP